MGFPLFNFAEKRLKAAEHFFEWTSFKWTTRFEITYEYFGRIQDTTFRNMVEHECSPTIPGKEYDTEDSFLASNQLITQWNNI